VAKEREENSHSPGNGRRCSTKGRNARGFDKHELLFFFKGKHSQRMGKTGWWCIVRREKRM
jgi:hypothetical protein